MHFPLYITSITFEFIVAEGKYSRKLLRQCTPKISVLSVLSARNVAELVSICK